jgi:hypothetical protein
MPINNALTPEGLNALGAAFGFYPQLRRNRTVQDPRAALDMPVQALRGRVAATAGMPSDILNMLRTPMPMEMYGDTDYGPQTQVPYGSQELLKTLPLPPQGPAQQAAANLGALAPMTPMEALQAARLARQAALAGGKGAKAVGRMAGEELNAAMFGERPGTILGALTPQPKFVFVGEKSKTWNKANATKAVEMEKAGAKPEDIWMATGTFRGPEGKLRQEISDTGAKFQPTKWDQPYPEHTDIDMTNISSALSHPELFKAYPQLGEANILLNPNITSLAEWNRAQPGIGINSPFMQMNKTVNPSIEVDWLKRMQDPNNPDYWKNQARYAIKEGFSPREAVKDMRQHMAETQQKINQMNQGVIPGDPSIALHELQHGIQEAEGFAKGGSAKRMASDIAQAKYDLKEVESKMINLQNAASDEARLYIAKAKQEPEFKKFVDEAFNKYKTQFGEKSETNPYGVNLEDAVKFRLLESTPTLHNFGLEADKLRKLSNLEPEQAYNRLAGEAEARAVQKRMNMTDTQRRVIFPYESYDVPINQLIVKTR